MQAAHDQSIIHRDLKPWNILLEDTGPAGATTTRGASTNSTATAVPGHLVAKISDFGLAKKLDDIGQTRTGEIMGTPSYMAPEQAQGKTRQIGPAVDIYALGAILYELLAGRPPFKAETVIDTLHPLLRPPPRPPARQMPTGPPAPPISSCSAMNGTGGASSLTP